MPTPLQARSSQHVSMGVGMGVWVSEHPFTSEPRKSVAGWPAPRPSTCRLSGCQRPPGTGGAGAAGGGGRLRRGQSAALPRGGGPGGGPGERGAAAGPRTPRTGLTQSPGRRRGRGGSRCPRPRDGGDGRRGAVGQRRAEPGAGQGHGQPRRPPAPHYASAAGAGAGAGGAGGRSGGGAGHRGEPAARRLGDGHRHPAEPQWHRFRGDAAPRLHPGLPPRANPLRDHPMDPAGLPRQDR